MTRPTWDNYFMDLMDSVSKRSTCDRGRSACVITKDNQIISTGYAGSPPGLPHCDEEGHMIKKVMDENGNERSHCVRTIHAEQNAICQAAKRGISINGSTVYCNMEPCLVCAKMLVASGVVKVVARKRYHAGKDSRELFLNSNVMLIVVEDFVEEY